MQVFMQQDCVPCQLCFLSWQPLSSFPATSMHIKALQKRRLSIHSRTYFRLFDLTHISAKLLLVIYPSYVQKQHMELFIVSSLRKSVHLFTTILLSLLLPLSFLLIARLSNVYYLLALNKSLIFTYPRSSCCFSYIFSLFLDANPILLHALVSLVTSATLIHSLTGISLFLIQGKTAEVPVFQPRLYAAWIFLCTLQVGVGLGISGGIVDEMDYSSRYEESWVICRVLFFLGLHETMIHWCKMIVKPVLGAAEEMKVVEKVCLGVSCGGLWWWKLRDEVEWMVCVAEVKREMGMDTRLADLVGWCLYYVTIVIGFVNVVKASLQFVTTLTRRCRSRDQPRPACPHNSGLDVVDKV